jgi:hypothetical protein
MPFRLISIVRSAAELQVRSRSFPAVGKRDDVMELEQATLAAPAAGADEGASPTVALPHFPFDRRRHMARTGLRIRNSAWSIGLRELLLLEFRQQHRQGAIEDRGWIPIRHRVTQEILYAA